MVVIDAADVTVRAGSAVLLDRVGFSAPAGWFTSVLGPNGAGKSTLLKVLAGGLRPATGEVRLCGRPLADWPRREASQRRAVLSQRTDLAFPISVRDVVLLGRSPYAGQSDRRTDRAIADSAMDMCGIHHLAARTYTTLSGGEQQRVQLARVLAQLHRQGTRFDDCEGQLLLLDEPTSSLDIAHQHAILGLARNLCGRGLAVIAVLHDLNLAAMFADAVHLMKSARIVEAGSPSDAIRPETVRSVFDVSVRLVTRAGQRTPFVIPLDQHA